MAVLLVKTYACNNATPASKNINLYKTTLGTKCATHNNPPAAIIDHANPAITFNSTCPLIMFANNRTDNDTNVDTNLNASIPTMNNVIANGDPAGNLNPLNFAPCLRTPTILFPNQIALPKVIVTTKCDVAVNPYGTLPLLLLNAMYTNNVNNTG